MRHRGGKADLDECRHSRKSARRNCDLRCRLHGEQDAPPWSLSPDTPTEVGPSLRCVHARFGIEAVQLVQHTIHCGSASVTNCHHKIFSEALRSGGYLLRTSGSILASVMTTEFPPCHG
jgi:hypothetical protein